MKNWKVIGLLVLLNACSYGQDTLHATDLTPTVGDYYVVNLATHASPGPSGINVLWDFSTFSPTSSDTARYADPQFPLSAYYSICHDLNFSIPYTRVCFFVDSTKVSLKEENWVWGSARMVYHGSKDLLKFPLFYGATHSDWFESSFSSSSGGGYDRYGSTTYRVDGFGTVLMPYGTVNNVYRLCDSINYYDVYTYEDSNHNTVFDTVSRSTLSYRYYAAGTHHPLVEMETRAGGGYSVEYVTSGGVLNAQQPESIKSFEIVGNPVSSTLMLSLKNITGPTPADILIYNAMGQKVLHEKVSVDNGLLEIAVRHLPNGTYFVVAAQEGVRSQGNVFQIAR